MYIPPCKSHDYIIFLLVLTEGGYSGAPLVIPRGDGNLTLSAVHTARLGDDYLRLAYHLDGQMRQWIWDAVSNSWPSKSKAESDQVPRIDDGTSSA